MTMNHNERVVSMREAEVKTVDLEHKVKRRKFGRQLRQLANNANVAQETRDLLQKVSTKHFGNIQYKKTKKIKSQKATRLATDEDEKGIEMPYSHKHETLFEQIQNLDEDES